MCTRRRYSTIPRAPQSFELSPYRYEIIELSNTDRSADGSRHVAPAAAAAGNNDAVDATKMSASEKSPAIKTGAVVIKTR